MSRQDLLDLIDDVSGMPLTPPLYLVCQFLLRPGAKNHARGELDISESGAARAMRVLQAAVEREIVTRILEIGSLMNYEDFLAELDASLLHEAHYYDTLNQELLPPKFLGFERLTLELQYFFVIEVAKTVVDNVESLAIEVFETQKEVRIWMRRPHPLLDDQSPQTIAGTALDA